MGTRRQFCGFQLSGGFLFGGFYRGGVVCAVVVIGGREVDGFDVEPDVDALVGVDAKRGWFLLHLLLPALWWHVEGES